MRSTQGFTNARDALYYANHKRLIQYQRHDSTGGIVRTFPALGCRRPARCAIRIYSQPATITGIFTGP